LQLSATMSNEAKVTCSLSSDAEPGSPDLNSLSRDQLRACVEVSKSITAELDPARLISTIMEKVSKLLPSETWSLFLLDDATQTLRFEISVDIDLETVKNFRLALGQGVAGKAAQLQRLLVVEDVSQCEFFFDKVDGTTGQHTESLICVPILYGGRTLGVLEVVNPKRVDATMLTQLRLLADYLAIAIENTRRYKLMEEMAVRDNLTGLFNQRYLYPNLKRLITRCRKANLPLSLIFMDMDDFKTVVDRLGHLNGSRALSEVAQRIQACLSEPAFGVAYGGDEFVLVLPELGRAQAVKLAAKIRRSVKNAPYLTRWGQQVSLTASFGVATFPEDADDSTSLLALADNAMFSVKTTGKDRVNARVKKTED
jgi:diguanylate cyclase (GGDEF)-like protein